MRHEGGGEAALSEIFVGIDYNNPRTRHFSRYILESYWMPWYELPGKNKKRFLF